MISKHCDLKTPLLLVITKYLILGTIEKEPHYSAGITLDHTNPERLIMSRLIDGQFEIEIWTTEDGVLWIRKQVS